MIVGIYLAAGQGRRMGRNKLAMSLGNEYVGSIALKIILQSRLDFTIVVTNPSDELIWLPPSVADNGRYSTFPCFDAQYGQSYSLKFGVKKAMEIGAEAIIIFLADQPFISTKLINELISHYKKGANVNVVASSFNHIPRPPVLFSEKSFAEILNLQGDQGARKLIRRKKTGEQIIIEFADCMPFIDIDNEEDFLRVRQLLDEKG
ncbi:nucleotidyltransferase family protein [Heyndrickxia vini]|uniref:NTP transferase domain-containing protein n=1 Tax=Heyndrickxia vini TaxID=1476025 RepID=A0ABX7E3D6_9BACI|nr:nucleotidyltransferase family protein [Heyndrickxia vini]QQZ09327.1 NTP transferase domain-containing protein [Heyndrickxia vini]